MSQYVTPMLKNDELIYAINVLDVQTLAKEKIGRELTFQEMNVVKKGIEWGFFNWFVVVNVAIETVAEIDKDKKD
jgi:hypothetical protein